MANFELNFRPQINRFFWKEFHHRLKDTSLPYASLWSCSCCSSCTYTRCILAFKVYLSMRTFSVHPCVERVYSYSKTLSLKQSLLIMLLRFPYTPCIVHTYVLHLRHQTQTRNCVNSKSDLMLFHLLIHLMILFQIFYIHQMPWQYINPLSIIVLYHFISILLNSKHFLGFSFSIPLC